MHRIFLSIIALMVIGFMSVPAHADISAVFQEDLTPVEQKVLDDIAAAKADGTYIRPPEAELTATVQVYSEDIVTSIPFPVGDQYCGIVQWNFGIPSLDCTYIGKAPTGQVWDFETSEWILESVIAEQAMQQEIASKAMALSPEEKQIQAFKNLVSKLEEKNKPTAGDLQAIAAFDSLTICMRGLEDTEAFQTKEFFVIPVESLQLVNGEWILVIPEFEDGSYNFGRNSGVVGELYMSGQECIAQMKLMGYSSPDHYRNLHSVPLPDDKICTTESVRLNKYDCQPYHADEAMTGKGTEAFGDDFTNRHDGDINEEAAKANFALCLSENFSDKYKKDNGCPSPYLGLFDDIVERNTDGLTTGNFPPMIDHAKYGTTCGLIPYQHIVDDRYWKYLHDLETKYQCWDEERITGIMLFNVQTWDEKKQLALGVIMEFEAQQ